jgi:hypothetical protein
MTKHNDRKAQAQHNLKAAINAMHEALMKASSAARELEPNEEDDGYDADFDRVVLMGYITATFADLDGPQIRVLSDIADALWLLERPETQSKPRPAIRLVDRKPEGNA